ncbi:hypothetical protein [Polaromonas sp. CG9_12]|nr:hypothetical protein [Polaromonas sp. CG9_12]
MQRNLIPLSETGQNQPTISTIFKLAAALDVKSSHMMAATEKLLDK